MVCQVDNFVLDGDLVFVDNVEFDDTKIFLGSMIVLIPISGGFAWSWSPQLGRQEDCAQPHHSQHKVQIFVQSCQVLFVYRAFSMTYYMGLFGQR